MTCLQMLEQSLVTMWTSAFKPWSLCIGKKLLIVWRSSYHEGDLSSIMHNTERFPWLSVHLQVYSWMFIYYHYQLCTTHEGINQASSKAITSISTIFYYSKAFTNISTIPIMVQKKPLSLIIKNWVLHNLSIKTGNWI